MTHADNLARDLFFLEQFRAYAQVLRNGQPTNWMWTGEHMSQNHVGITEARAKELQAQHGGIAKPMPNNEEA